MLRTLIIWLMAAGLSFPSFAGEAHKQGSGHSGHGTHQSAGLTLTGAFARATLPNQPVGGGFLQISNHGEQDDRLVSVTSSIAGRSEIHEMAMQGDMMKMRELADGLVIPAGETVVLAPGGFHLMFMDLAGPLVEGERFDATLEFEHAGAMRLSFIIQGRGAKAMDNSGHSHGHGS